MRPSIERPRRGGARRQSSLTADERGFTLVELLVASLIFIAVLGAILSVFESVFRGSQNDNERNTSLAEQTAALHRMTAELRQAYKVVGPTAGSTSNYMDVLVRITRTSGTQVRRVLYRCDNTVFSTGLQQCLRYEFSATDPSPAGTPPGSATATVAIPRISNGTSADPVFTELSSPSGTGGGPTYGKATIKTPGAGERPSSTPGGYKAQLALSDGFYLRNRDLAH